MYVQAMSWQIKTRHWKLAYIESRALQDQILAAQAAQFSDLNVTNEIFSIRKLTAVYVGHLFMPFTQSFHPKVRAFALLTPDAIESVLFC